MFNVMSFQPINFGRYASQTEHSMDDTNELDDDNSMIPPLMSLNVAQHQPLMTIKTSTIPKENIEPLPFPQHKPGPIQRPINLQFASVLQTTSTMFQDSPQSPNTPDVLVQINHLVDHQNSLLQTPSTLINDLPTPSASWTPFTPNEWSSTWSTANNQNLFAQRQLSKDDSSFWPGIPNKDSWLKFSPAPEPTNRQENDANWWPKASSNENNNNNNNNDNDHSRWDFAR